MFREFSSIWEIQDEDGLLWTLLHENSVKDRLLEKGSEQWLSKVDAAKPKLQT